jgi:hypothetical protein
MECVVNDQYRYIMFYGAKVACTSLRNLYLAIHQDEMTDEQLAQLNGYHNLNDVCAFDPDKDYSSYYKFYISRNPYGRVVSAFLDQYTLSRHSGVALMFERCPPQGDEPQTFIELLRYLKEVPDHQRDSHFRTQSHFGYRVILHRAPYFRKMHPDQLALNYFGDVGQFNAHLEKVYRKIFKGYPAMRERALREIGQIPRMNNLMYGEKTWQNAAELSPEVLRQMPFLPKPQDFFTSDEAKELVQEIYARDFQMFDYPPHVIPQKKPSKELELIPDDFDWQTYALLNPDLAPQGVENERSLTHHFLMHGRIEDKKRFYKIEAPEGFDWQRYLQRNSDLEDAGVDNERDAIIHYLTFGYHEQREI